MPRPRAARGTRRTRPPVPDVSTIHEDEPVVTPKNHAVSATNTRRRASRIRSPTRRVLSPASARGSRSPSTSISPSSDSSSQKENVTPPASGKRVREILAHAARALGPKNGAARSDLFGLHAKAPESLPRPTSTRPHSDMVVYQDLELSSEPNSDVSDHLVPSPQRKRKPLQPLNQRQVLARAAKRPAVVDESDDEEDLQDEEQWKEQDRPKRMAKDMDPETVSALKRKFADIDEFELEEEVISDPSLELAASPSPQN